MCLSWTIRRDRGGYRIVKCGCGPIKGFYRHPIHEFFSLFLNKKKNYHCRIVCKRDREVFRGHVARARCRDAATLSDATAALNVAGPDSLIYLHIYTTCFLVPILWQTINFVLYSYQRRKRFYHMQIFKIICICINLLNNSSFVYYLYTRKITIYCRNHYLLKSLITINFK